MSKTPDRIEQFLDFIEQAGDPAYAGQIGYVGGSFRLKDSVGVFDPRSGGGGITETQHKSLRQLIHFLDDGPGDGFGTGPYDLEIYPSASPFPTRYTWWTTSGHTARIAELIVTRNANQTPSTELWKVFSADGVGLEYAVKDTITYSGIFETGRSREPLAFISRTIQTDGLDEYVSFPHVAGQSLTTAWSVVCWRRVDTYEGADEFISKSDNSNRGFRLKQHPTDGRDLLVYVAASASDGTTYGRWPDVFTSDVWEHLAVVYDGAGAADADKLKAYLNGVLLTADLYNATIPTSMYATTAPVRVGSGNSGTLPFLGELNNVGVYNTPLSAADVTAVYGHGTKDLRTLSSGAGLVCYPGLSEGAPSFPAILDLAGVSNGTATNMEPSDITENTP